MSSSSSHHRSSRSRRSSSRRRSSSSSPPSSYDTIQYEIAAKAGIELSKALTLALLSSPSLLDELPAMARALDEGEPINVNGIRIEKRRQCVEKVLSLIPGVCHEVGVGFFREKDATSVRESMLNSLLACGAIIEPRDLTEGQEISSQQAPLTLLDLVNTHSQALLSELPTMLETILDGQGVDLSGLENKSLADDLGRLLKQLGMRNTVDEERFWEIPSSSDDRRNVKDAVKHILKALYVYEDSLPAPSTTSVVDTPVVAASTSVTTDTQAIPDSKHVETQGKRKIGPSVPTMEMLSVAASSSVAPMSDDSDDDDVGPMPYVAPRVPVDFPEERPVNEPVGMFGITVFKNNALEESDLPSAEDATVREEWMLDPGKNKTISEVHGDMPVARRFAMSKSAKKNAESLQIQAEYQRSLETQKITSTALNEVNSEQQNDQARPMSLMEEHLAKIQKKKTATAAVTGGRTGFDRERDIVRRQLNAKDVDNLVQGARELGSRFAQGGSQRSS